MSRKNMVIPKGLTRSKKKKYVNNQIAIAKGMNKTLKKISDAARGYAKILTKQQPWNATNVLNRLGFCPSCKMYYCFCYNGTIAWCNECRLQGSCLKLNYPEDADRTEDPVIIRLCKPCRWDRLDIIRAQAEQKLLPQSRWRERKMGAQNVGT